MESLISIKQQLIEVGKRLYLKNLTSATSGNISIKTTDGIYITSTGSVLGNLSEKEIIFIDFEGKEISEGKASSEKMLHVELYKKRPDISAIIHTHPVNLTSFAACHIPLNEAIMAENILYFEDIPVAEYAMPSSMELVDNTVKCLANRDVAMMANHGAIAIADTIEHAFLKMETAEYYAQVTLNTRLLGGAKVLSEKDVQDLINLKSK